MHDEKLLLVFSEKITNRKKYIFRLIFKDILLIDYNLTSSYEDFDSYKGPKFAYTKFKNNDHLFFQSSGILDQSGLEEASINIFDYKNSKAFFQIFDKNSVLPFDVFSASFYLVSRYEEYFPYIKDQYDRFHPEESLAYKENFLHKPQVNIWANFVKDELIKHFPDLKFPIRKFEFVPTYDIDLAYAYKLKGFVRTAAGYAKSLGEGNFKDIVERTQVLLGRKKDPFDTYEFMLNLHKKYKLKPIYFILFAAYGQFDKNTPTFNLKFRSLIKSLADYGDVGVHPSFESNGNRKALQGEIDKLSQVLNREIIHSRQHFLKLSFPDTYRNLIKYDVKHDYTMGYASAIGFRASICVPYNFFDLDLDVETKLRIHPFTFMEGTLKDYQKLDNNNTALEFIKSLIDEVKAVDGTLYTLWHNESLSNAKRWEGWREIYEKMIKYIIDPS